MRDLFLTFRARFEEELRGTGVTLPQLRMLKMVEGQQGVSAAAIARSCHVTPQTLHAMLARAAREGWIVRGSSDRNHRFVTASLTPQGQAIIQIGTQLRERMEAELWRGMPLASIQAVREALEAGLRNLQRAPREPDAIASHPKP
ncbi:MAG TPA: MarR family transcriptional regulator [Acidobacteriaceae bacterium]|nr:MarR family transcriptional regulator [Acidobacteriaceae bacterium]